MGKRIKKQVSSNWAGLPDDLLDSILEKFASSLSDIIRFSYVCKPWNSKAKEKFIQQPPCLLVNSMFWLNPIKTKQTLYNFTDASKILNLKLCIPYIYKNRECFGSSYGWLFYKEIMNSTIVVLNPISGIFICLPRMLIPNDIRASFGDFKDFILSSNPCFRSFEVLATCSSYDYDIVAHQKFGDKFWTYSQRTTLDHLYSFAFYKNSILGVSKSGRILSLDIIHSSNESSRSIKFKEIPQDLNEVRNSSSILSSTFVKTFNDDLLLVHSYRKYGDPQQYYKVFKIMYLNGKFDIIQVVNLDGHSLFLKNNPYHPNLCISIFASNFNPYHQNQCISVLASDYDGICRENSIYYSYEVGQGEDFLKCRIEEFNLEDESVKTEEQWFPISQSESMFNDERVWMVPLIML